MRTDKLWQGKNSYKLLIIINITKSGDGVNIRMPQPRGVIKEIAEIKAGL
jgi:hypothetical protein